MKRTALVAILVLLVFGLTGCQLLDRIIPDVPINFDLEPFTLDTEIAGFASFEVDVTGEPDWTNNADRIRQVVSLELNATLTNRTGAVQDLRLYISDDTYATAEQLAAAATAGDAVCIYTFAVPGTSPYDFSTGAIPLGNAAADIIIDGSFTCYVVGPATDVDIDFDEPTATLVIKPGL